MGSVHAIDADGFVVGLGGVSGVVGGAVGVGQHGVEAVDDGLHFGSGIGLCAGDIGVVQSAVDGGQVLCGHTGHAHGGVLRSGGCGVGGVVELGGGFNHGQVADGVADHRLHTRVGVELGGIVGSGQSGLHGAEVGAGDAGHTQSEELRLGGVAIHHGLHGVG